VDITASFTALFANFNTANDISAVIPLTPLPPPAGVGAGVDVAFNAPQGPSGQPAPEVFVGVSRNLGAGTFVGPSGRLGGLDINLGVPLSPGPVLGASVPVANACSTLSGGGH
jgi:hypothetical protein